MVLRVGRCQKAVGSSPSLGNDCDEEFRGLVKPRIKLDFLLQLTSSNTNAASQNLKSLVNPLTRLRSTQHYSNTLHAKPLPNFDSI